MIQDTTWHLHLDISRHRLPPHPIVDSGNFLQAAWRAATYKRYQKFPLLYKLWSETILWHKHNVLEITIKSKRQLDLTTISMQPFACHLRAALWVDCKHAIFSFLRRPHMTFLSFFVYSASIIKLSHSEFQKIIFFRIIGVYLYNPFSGIIRVSCGFSATSAHAPQVLMHLVWLLSAWQSESHFWLQGREDLLPFCS